MDPVTPVLNLLFQVNPNELNDYFLKSESPFEQSNFVACGHHPIPSGLNENNELSIGPLVLQDVSLPAENGPITVNHMISLGNLDYGIDDFLIEVSVYDQNNTLRGRGHIRNTSAKEIGKPL